MNDIKYNILEKDIGDRVTGSFYAGIIQGLLIYSGFEGTKVEFKIVQANTWFDIEFHERFNNQMQN